MSNPATKIDTVSQAQGAVRVRSGACVCTVEVRCEVEADGTRNVTVSGEIDLATADTFQEGLLQAIDGATGGEVVVDMSGVGFGDSSCLNALVAAYRIA